jgi:hypothetical protein
MTNVESGSPSYTIDDIEALESIVLINLIITIIKLYLKNLELLDYNLDGLVLMLSS